MRSPRRRRSASEPAIRSTYFDMENYTRTAAATSAVLAFLESWTTELHDAGYASGVYSSADSGITDLVDSYGSG